MKNNKVPGIDGLTKEFYITFWDLIGDHLLEVFEEMCETGRMPKSMRTGVISLLHKKGSPAVLSNYRPLSMVCVDYKILSRTLARRLARVLPAIINADQTCGVKGRQIGWNLQLHRDVLTYIEERNLTTICVTLDEEKAFDRVNHDFLWRVMRNFDIGGKILNWISMMYTDIICKIKINGHLTEEVQQTRGLQQGCPLSALLYVIYVEPLACAIRGNEKIRGVPLPGVLKISQYADDTVLYLEDDGSVREMIRTIQTFESAVGSKVNEEKSKYKFLGRWAGRRETLCGLSLCEGPMRVLGIDFGNPGGDANYNWDLKIAKILKKLGMWSKRTLTITGKVLVVKADILPALLHLAYVFPMPQTHRKVLTWGIFKLIWAGV